MCQLPAAKLGYGQTHTSGEKCGKNYCLQLLHWSLYFSTSYLQKVLFTLLLWLCAKNVFCNTCFYVFAPPTKVWWYMAPCTWSPMRWVVAWCLRARSYWPNQCWPTYMPFYITAQRISCDFQSHVLKNMIKNIYHQAKFLYPSFM